MVDVTPMAKARPPSSAHKTLEVAKVNHVKNTDGMSLQDESANRYSSVRPGRVSGKRYKFPL